KRAYKFARRGEEVELKPKILEIKEIEILRFDKPLLELRIVCSKGTYIRALARDIGEALHSGAYLVGLKRTRIGRFTIEESLTLNDLEIKLAALAKPI
ncbi:MAG: tRNA pseudouridine(55) synthase, partial [Marinilabiliales bacterium]|nr:tRNA pseudouridine(55) synthase [Marinilabiliales bacterium]